MTHSRSHRSRRSRTTRKSRSKSISRSRSRSQSKVRIPISKEEGIPNYHFKMPVSDRRSAVRRAVHSMGKNTVIWRLNALSTVHKRSNPNYSKKAKSDMKYAQTL